MKKIILIVLMFCSAPARASDSIQIICKDKQGNVVAASNLKAAVCSQKRNAKIDKILNKLYGEN